MAEPQPPEKAEDGVVLPPKPAIRWSRWEIWIGLGICLAFIFWSLLIVNSFNLVSALFGLGFLGALLGIAVLMALMGHAVLGPLDRTARHVKARVQFTLIDILCLFLWVQAPMALIHSWGHGAALVPLDLFVWLAVAAVWGLSVQRLSRAGIVQAGRRAVMLAFVIPTTLVSLFAAPLLVLAGIICLKALWSGTEQPWPPRYTIMGLLGALALSSLVVLAAKITRRFVADASSQ